jgi:phosphoribosylformylglycinamidine synthase subunit PurS
MAYKAKIQVTLRPSILDVQGKAVGHALDNLGYSAVDAVRIGKYIGGTISEEDEKAAGQTADEICRKLLANTVMEDYSIELEKI